MKCSLVLFFYLYAFEYSISAWGRANGCILKPLGTAQKRIIKSIDGATYREQTNPLFLKYSILKLKWIYSHVTCVHMFKLIRTNKFYSTHKVNTRNKDKIQPVYLTLSMRQITKSFSGPKEWNCLPLDIRNNQTTGKF